MANINLSKENMYEAQLFDAARKHYGPKQSMATKRELDRAATFFRKHVVTLNPKIDDACTRQESVSFIIGNNKSHNRVVTMFTGKPFTSIENLNKQVQKEFKKIEKFVKVDKKEKIKFNVIGATANLDKISGNTENIIIACGDFISSAYVHNFCHLE